MIRIRPNGSSLDFRCLPVKVAQVHRRRSSKQCCSDRAARPAVRWTERPDPYCPAFTNQRPTLVDDARNPSPTLSTLTHKFLSPLHNATCVITPCCGRLAKCWQQSKIRSSFISEPPLCEIPISFKPLFVSKSLALTSPLLSSFTFHFPDARHVSSYVCPLTNRRSFTFSSNHVEARRAAHATLSSRVFCLIMVIIHCSFVVNAHD